MIPVPEKKMTMAGRVCKLFLEYPDQWLTRSDIAEGAGIPRSWVATVMKNLQKERMFALRKISNAFEYCFYNDDDKVERAKTIRDTPREPPAITKGRVLERTIFQLLQNTEQLLLTMGAYEPVRKEFDWGGGKSTRTELERRPLKYGTPEDEAFLDKLTATVKELLDMRGGIENLTTEIGIAIEMEE